MKRFALIGAAGYIAPAHMKAIKETGHELVAAYDLHDNVGVMDQYFPEVQFFTEFERFERHLDKQNRSDRPIDYLVVCSPNYLHDAHCRYGLRAGMEVICEKPLVLNPWNLEGLKAAEQESGKHINNILQLRLHPEIKRLKQRIAADTSSQIHPIKLQYITARGPWYHTSWKGDETRSGGIMTNIGVHLFDMLLWIFGPLQVSELSVRSNDKAAGTLHLKRATVNWQLSIDRNDLPEPAKQANKSSYRRLEMEGVTISLDDQFSELHQESYRTILAGKGFSIADIEPTIALVHQLRHQSLS